MDSGSPPPFQPTFQPNEIYRELRRLAGHYMSAERPGHTLQPTALVHEAWMRFDGAKAVAQNKSHFIALAAGVMKEVLIDHARKHRAAKRGGGEAVVTLTDSMDFAGQGSQNLIDLCDCLERLRELSPRQAQLVELHVFGGMNFEEAASVLSISTATAKRDWALARAWLYRELS